MNTSNSDTVSVTVSPTFGEQYAAALRFLPLQGKAMLLIHSVFPLAGVGLLILPKLTRQGLGPSVVFLAVACFLFTPLILAQGLFFARKNKLAKPPFTYRFDDDGMHLSGSSFDQNIKWVAIPRVRRTKRFLYVFIGKASAHALSIRALRDQHVLEEVCSIAGKHTDYE